MKAAVLHEIGGPFVVEEVELLPPEPHEVRVRLAAAGTCHSDWHFVAGLLRRPLPLVLGHEGAGVVEEVGADVTSVRPGQHVILNWAPSCRRLFLLPGRPVGPVRDQLGLAQRHHAGRLHPAAAERRSGAPVQRAVHLRGADHRAGRELRADRRRRAVRGGRPGRLRGDHTGVGAALNTVHIRPGESAVVFGCGGVGLNILQGARLSSAQPIIAVDTDPAKEQIAYQFGATHWIQGGGDEAAILEQVRDLTGGRGADFCVRGGGHSRPAGAGLPGRAARRHRGGGGRGAGRLNHPLRRP